ncbi:MAG: ATP-dependent zinc protease [Candidatus Methylomirabilales bacterium]
MILGIRADRQVGLGRFVVYFAIAALLPLTVGTADAGEKLTIGAVEDVILLPWKVTLPARIDTGATRSSLDARDLTVRDNEVVFTLPDAYGGLELRLPIIEWRVVRSAVGKERRPVVEIELCLGPKRFRTQVNLSDRSRVQYPFLVGRLALQGRFLVDVSQSKVFPPSCPEASSQ